MLHAVSFPVFRTRHRAYLLLTVSTCKHTGPVPHEQQCHRSEQSSVHVSHVPRGRTGSQAEPKHNLLEDTRKYSPNYHIICTTPVHPADSTAVHNYM